MSSYYGYKRLAYQPGQKGKYRMSRSKIELFVQCKRCFWLDARKNISRPPSAPFNINKAIDELFKKEFDIYRAKKEPHPIMSQNGLKDIWPLPSAELDTWRDTFVGVATLHQPTNLEIYGGLDDVWTNSKEELFVVDYKATSKDKEVSIDSSWQITYKRQVEIYQWLLSQNGYKVNPTAYFVYTNARQDMASFDDHLKFKTKLIAYQGNTAWIERTLSDIKQCLEGDMPEVGESIMGGPCEFCAYAKARTSLTLEALATKRSNTKKP